MSIKQYIIDVITSQSLGVGLLREQIITEVINKSRNGGGKRDKKDKDYGSMYIKTNIIPMDVNDEIDNMLRNDILFQPLINHNSPIGITTYIKPILSMMGYTFKSVDDIINNIINTNQHTYHGSYIDLNIMRTIIQMEMCGYIEIREVMSNINMDNNIHIHNNTVTIEVRLSPNITLVD